MKKIFFFLLVLFSACNSEDKQKNKIVEDADQAPMSQLDSLSAAIVEEPNNANTYYKRALYFHNEGEFEQALSDIDRALIVDSLIAEFHYVKGNIFYDEQIIKNAFESYQKALELDPEHESTLLKLSQIELILKHYDLAIEMVNKALRLNPMNPSSYYLKGFIYLDGGDTATAVSSFQTAIEVDPEHYDSYVMLGKIWAKANPEYSENYYDQALRIQPTSIEALYNKGMLFQNEERYIEAYAIYDEIIAIDSASYFAYYNKGYMLLVSDSTYEGAIQEFEKSLQYYPYYIQAYYNIGLCYENLEDIESAEKNYKKALEIDPQYDAAARGLSRIYK